MNGFADREANFWPFTRRTALISVPVILVVLVLVVVILRSAVNWPAPGSDGLVLTGVLVLGLLPLGLSLLDVIASRGGSVAYAGLRIDFAAVVQPTRSITLPANIGVRGVAVPDSSSVNILETLRDAVNNDIVVVDLEDGLAWWETRLLVLCAGAARLGRPRVIVFLATQRELSGCFEGWAIPNQMLAALLKTNAQYRRSYYAAQAAARQWALIPPQTGGLQPPPLPFFQGLAQSHSFIAYSGSEPNEMAAEQFLASDLGTIMEPPQASFTVTTLRERFSSVLHTESVDDERPPQQRVQAFLQYDTAYVALTSNGRYVGLLSRTAGQNAILTSLMEATLPGRKPGSER